MTDPYYTSITRLQSTITSITTHTLTPASAAHNLFTWLSSIISGDAPPFDTFNYPTPPGDTPRMQSFTTALWDILVCTAQRTHDNTVDDLVAFADEFYARLKATQWVCGGETMECPSLGMLGELGNNHPFELCEDGEPPGEEVVRMVVSRTRFFALLVKRLGFGWLRETLVRQVVWGVEKGGDGWDAARVVPLLELMGVAGEELYRAREGFDAWRVDERGMGFCEGMWEEWMDALKGVAENGSEEEVRGTAGKTVVVMAGVRERCRGSVVEL